MLFRSEWGLGDYWGCADWITWHKALIRKHGEKRADIIWANAWLDGVSTAGGGRGTADGSNAVFDSVPIDCRSFNAEFRTYVNNRPVLKSAVFSGLGGFIGGIVSNGVKIVSGGADVLGGAAEGASNFGKMLRWAIPTLIVTAAVFVGYRVYKEVKA